MPHAILIAFEYRALKIECDTTQCAATPFVNFPGAIIDLHLVYSFCRDQKWSSAILTDITEERYPPNIVSLATSGAVSIGALQFFKDHNSTFGYCNDRKTFLNYLKEECTRVIPDKKVLFYYTGHGIRTKSLDRESKSSILLPNNEIVDFTEFASIITKLLPKETEILCVLDCCHPGSLSLPYRLKMAETKEGESAWELLPDYSPILQKMLCITSATFDEDSNSLPYGSIFTNVFFTHLSQLTVELPTTNTLIPWPNRSLKSVSLWASGEIQKRHLLKQTVTVYSSYKVDPIVPLWIGRFTWNFTFDIHSNIILKLTEPKASKNKENK